MTHRLNVKYGKDLAIGDIIEDVVPLEHWAPAKVHLVEEFNGNVKIVVEFLDPDHPQAFGSRTRTTVVHKTLDAIIVRRDI